MSQKKIFLESEADAWFRRNRSAVANKDFATNDPVTVAVEQVAALPVNLGKKLRVLEIGCGEGGRLAWLSQNLGAEVRGLDPSALAVEQACDNGVEALQGTADALPYEDAAFDLVIFGFCLYLCDRQDLFCIAKEADRVLGAQGWVILHDFYSTNPVRRIYHHRPGVFSYKMDYRKLFDWHPSYTCFSHKVEPHGQVGFTDDANEWVATSVLRKNFNTDE